jgi:hypothetical protein
VVLCRGATPTLEFWGHGPDAELATYLFGVVKGAMDREFETFRKGRYGASKRNFQLGMAARVNGRLREMIRAREEAVRRNPGNLPALVQEKEAAAERALAEAYGKLRSSRSSRKINYGADSFTAGMRAGDNVHLGTAMGADRAAGTISG